MSDSGSDISDFCVAAPAADPRRKRRVTVQGNSKLRSALEHNYVCALAREAKSDRRKDSMQYVQEVASVVKMKVNTTRSLRTERQRQAAIKKISKSKILKPTTLDRNADTLQVVFHKSTRASDVAKSEGISHPTVLLDRQKVSYVVKEHVLAVLKKWKALCLEDNPLYVFHGRKYDSATIFTSSPIDIPGLQQVTPQQCRRPIHFFVQKRCIMIVFPNKTVELKYPVHDIPAQSTNAACVHNCLDKNEQTQEMQQLATDIMGTASVMAIEGDGCDRAAPNLKYEEWRKDHPQCEHFEGHRHKETCGNHGTALHSDLIEDYIAGDLLGKVGSCTTLFRTGGFLVRALSMLLPTILAGLRLVDGYPDPEWRKVTDFACEQSLFFYKRYVRAYTDEKFEVGLQRLEAAWAEFKKWWNGRLDAEGIYFHYYRATGHSAGDEQTVAIGMANSISRLFLKCLPPKMEKGKWTKLAPSFDFIVQLSLPNMLIRPLLELAGKKIQSTVQNFNGDWSALSFSEAQGVRYSQSMEVVSDDWNIFIIRLCSLLFFPIRILHDFYFKASKNFQMGSKNLLYDLINPRFSPIWRSLQYLAALGTGTSRHLVILRGAYYTIYEWGETMPERKWALILSSYMLSVSVHRRDTQRVRSPLYKLLSIGDDRIPLATRKQTQVDVRSKPNECCSGSIVAATIALGVCFFTAQFAMAVRALGFFIAWLLSIADIERKHGQTKRRFSKHGSHFVGTSCKSYLEEVRYVSVHAAKRAAEIVSYAADSVMQALPSISQEKKSSRKKVGYDAYKDLKMREVEIEERSKKDLLFTRRGQQDINTGWKALSDGERAEFDLLVEEKKDDTAIVPAVAVPAQEDRPSEVPSSLAIFNVRQQMDMADLLDAMPSNMLHVPLALHETISPAALMGEIAPHAGLSVAMAEAATKEEDADTMPIHPEVYTQLLAQHGLENVEAISSAYKAFATRLATDDKSVPEEVIKIVPLCGKYCNNDPCNAKLIRLRKALLDMQTKFVAAKCKLLKCRPPALYREQFLLVFELDTPSLPDRATHFAQLALANARAGSYDPFQGYMRMQLKTLPDFDPEEKSAGEFSYIGAVVGTQHDAQVVVQHQDDKFLDDNLCGASQVVTHEEVADEILELVDVTLTAIPDHERPKIHVYLREHEWMKGTWSDRKIIGGSLYSTLQYGDDGNGDDGSDGTKGNRKRNRKRRRKGNDSDSSDFGAKAKVKTLTYNTEGSGDDDDSDALIDEEKEVKSDVDDEGEDSEEVEESEAEVTVVPIAPVAPVGPLIPAPPERQLSMFDLIQQEEGLYEENYILFRSDGGGAVGRIEFIHGQTLSYKADCDFYGHNLSPEELEGLSKKEKRQCECACLISATRDGVTKYRRLCQWLRDGRDLTRQEHLELRDKLRAEFS